MRSSPLSFTLFATLLILASACQSRHMGGPAAEAQTLAANESPAKVTPAQIFLTGDERTVVDDFVSEAEELPAERFGNALDHTLAVLTDRAHPKPETPLLIRETVLSFCEELQRHTQQHVGAAQWETWVDDVSRSMSFEKLLNVLDTHGLEQDVRNGIVEAGLRGMLKGLRPGFGRLLERGETNWLKKLREIREDPANEPGMLGLDVHRWPIAEVLPGTPADEAGIQGGDRVVMVDGERVGHVETVTEAMQLLAGPVGKSVELTVKRGSETFTFEVRRAPAAAMRVQARWLNEGIAYVGIPTFEGSGIGDRVQKETVKFAADGASSVILDLRYNTGGRPEEANAVADLFLDDKLLQVFEFKTGVRVGFKSNPGSIDVPVVILTNKFTASAAEILTMALRDNGRGTVVGEITAGSLYGKDNAELAGGYTIYFRNEPTVLSPTGKDYSQIGIPPDIMIADSVDSQEDAVLMRAIEFVNSMYERDDDNLTEDSTDAGRLSR